MGLIFGILGTSLSWAAADVTTSNTSQPLRTLTLAVPNAIPPYAIKSLNRGIEIDIVRAALNHQGYDFTPEYVPLGRLNHTLTSGEVDGAMTVKEGLIRAKPIYFSKEPHVYYQNVAISLSERGFVIDELDQLQNYSIAVFQTPGLFIGPSWTEMRAKNTNPVFELSNQESQVKMLYAGRIDTLVMDINIFHYYRRQLPSTPEASVTVHPILPRNYVKVAFADAEVTSAFDRGLAAIRANGQYLQILSLYKDDLKSD